MAFHRSSDCNEKTPTEVVLAHLKIIKTCKDHPARFSTVLRKKMEIKEELTHSLQECCLSCHSTYPKTGRKLEKLERVGSNMVECFHSQ